MLIPTGKGHREFPGSLPGSGRSGVSPGARAFLIGSLGSLGAVMFLRALGAMMFLRALGALGALRAVVLGALGAVVLGALGAVTAAQIQAAGSNTLLQLLQFQI